ncbi:glycosyltransferase family 4 protein [Lentzea sp. HUAS12]|uniref:glycosyltransferase family 4 protein n=1 Tax=Lentzea sp. HUAS12 TaxID=2951806 RepID=UPI00209D3A2E|nr:glycosyltransferase family 4 protein [Lentzea sp. HUAS12]USX50035.1 glycosyltransferase family 4 protein [Lentzea sp. HUAS12]
MAEPKLPVACTVATRSGLPAAKVLAASYREHHPGHEFVILVLDGPDGVVAREQWTEVGPGWLDLDETTFQRMATAYDSGELAGAVKPLVLRKLLSQGAPAAIFLHPDIRVFAPYPEVVDLAVQHDIVLTARLLEPMPRDGYEPSDLGMMAMGMFDLGFIAVGQGSKKFLEFWAERLRQDAIIDPGAQLFVDQRWADQIPTLFRHTILRDPGFNIGYWNAHERSVTRGPDGTLYAGGERLRFFHFAGYRPDQPWLLSQHCHHRPRILLSDHPELRELCLAYGEELLAAGWRKPQEKSTYRYDWLADGTRVSIQMRRMFRHAWIEAERPEAKQMLFKRAITEIPPHPFGSGGDGEFIEWLRSPGAPPEEAAGLNRMTMLAWAMRPDLQKAFPWPCAADAPGFREWCRTYGVEEGVVPTWALPREPRAAQDPLDEFGVNIAGYLTAELGLGEMGRIVLKAVEAAEVPVVSVVEEHSLACRTDLEQPDSAGRPKFPVSVMAVNSDQTEVLLASFPEVGHRRYRIGLWAWELEEVPPWQQAGYEFVDEIWTVSEFCREAFQQHGSVPVKVIPVPVLDPGAPQRTERAPGKPTQFFFAFDFNSTGGRKNPWGVVEAFSRAFPSDRQDVRLVIKATNGQLHTNAAERLRLLVAADPRIELMERYLSVDELNALYRDSDCYVSLHRSEGFGLTVAEAMVRGMPVISTDYSSTTEFFDPSVGWAIPYKMVEVGEGWYPYPADALWADPDLDAAAKAMREVADDPAEARRRGDAARQHILRTRSMDAAASWMRTELRAAHARWQAIYGEQQDSPDPQDPFTRAREALKWRADTSSPSRLPLAPALRRAVLRAVDHFDVHQRKIMGELVGSAQQAFESVARSVSSHDKRLDDMARQIRKLENKLERRNSEDSR